MTIKRVVNIRHFKKFRKLLTDFYNICEQYNLPYPKTVLVNPKSEIDTLVDELTFPYPMILKPGNSISYLDVHFEGQKKAFTIASNEEMKLMLHR